MEITSETKISFLVKSNPKREGSKAHARFSKYMGAKTVAEYLEKGGTKADLKYDSEKKFIQIG
jgi:hypothetical protein